MLARYFVLIDIKVEKADAHKYAETNGKEHLLLNQTMLDILL